MLKEFKAFALRGNVMDMAVGVIIGAAFSKIINSLVADIIMPPLGMLVGKVDFSQFILEYNGTQVKVGMFLNECVNFTIVAFAIFMIVRQINKLFPPPPKEEGPTLKDCPFCLSDIQIKAIKCPNCTADLKAA